VFTGAYKTLPQRNCRRTIKVTEEEFILFKRVKIEEIFGREEDFLLRIEGSHI
jgi:hypothetical protein